MQIFVQPEDLCIVKAKKKRHFHYTSLHSDQRETTLNNKKEKPNLNKPLP